MLNKEEIEIAKDDLMFFNEGDYITREMDRSADVLEEYIEQLETENSKLNKIIDEMASELADYVMYYDYSKCRDLEMIKYKANEIKQYFEKKVEGKL